MNYFNYDSALHFKFEGVEVNAIILFFSIKAKDQIDHVTKFL